MKKGVFIAAVLCMTFFMSCDRLTENGRLDGMWQLLSVSYSLPAGEDSLVNVKSDKVYLSFQNDLAQITPGSFKTDSMGQRVLMRFRKTSSRLKLHDFHVFRETTGPIGTERHSEEKLLVDSAETMLRPFGIDGIYADFRIEKLSGDAMVLSSDYARLVLRKF